MRLRQLNIQWSLLHKKLIRVRGGYIRRRPDDVFGHVFYVIYAEDSRCTQTTILFLYASISKTKKKQRSMRIAQHIRNGMILELFAYQFVTSSTGSSIMASE